MNKLQIVVDFDGTLMHQDVGDEIMEKLGIFDRPEAIEAGRRYREREHGSMGWAKVTYAMLEGRQAEVDKVLKTVYPRAGAAAFLNFCRDNGIPVHLLSDGMEYYIRRSLELHRLKPDTVTVNPITYTSDGQYQLRFQNNNPACSWCGCCKAGYVQALKKEGNRVIYVGDGSSDFFGSAFADWVFARASLVRHREKVGDDYFPFETFHDIMKILEPNLDRFASGEMPIHRGTVLAQCRFAD